MNIFERKLSAFTTLKLTQRHTSSRIKRKLILIDRSNSELIQNKVYYKCCIGDLEVRFISVLVTHKDKMTELYSDIFNYLECAFFMFEKEHTSSGKEMSTEKLQDAWFMFNESYRHEYIQLRKNNKK